MYCCLGIYNSFIQIPFACPVRLVCFVFALFDDIVLGDSRFREEWYANAN